MKRDISFEETSKRWSLYYSQVAGGMNDEKFTEEFNKYTYSHTWRNSVRIISNKAGIKDGAKVLDAGCGWGRMLLGVAENFKSLDITALDFQKDAIEKGRELIGENINDNRINWVQGDIQSLDFDENSFDAIYSSRVFQHLNNPEDGIKELLRVVRPGGTILIFVQNKICPLNLNYYSRLYSPNEVKRWFNNVDVLNLKVSSMDFFPSFLALGNSGKMALGAESLLEKIPLLNYLGGKVLVTATKP